ncbi:carbonic anhydrase [Alloscardovia sp. HMSC034E08]|uniref:carbonic anhydrase n=1 Tax=Alloscardovia sp. HMSC034E08 TaxID=1739413 RepID=UPI0008AC8B16|nr:carbonic anhydrase [Alloscardovia sp. HMSC034E08]OFQ98320.1 carbonate dehydratase [Alloscardovia sp. HMSC034E08]
MSVLAEENQANSVWTRMLEGNKRFARGKAVHPWQDKETRESLYAGQNPSAAVLACADSRVSPEIIFDEGLGDIFTIRSVGGVLDQAVINSLEFAVDILHVSVLVVMSHEHCGLLEAAVNSAKTGNVPLSLTYAIGEVAGTMEAAEDADSQDDVERIHVSTLIMQLVERSEIIARALAAEELKIVGARYTMSNGLVEVLSF